MGFHGFSMVVPETEVPLVILLFHRTSYYRPSKTWNSPIYGKPQMVQDTWGVRQEIRLCQGTCGCCKHWEFTTKSRDFFAHDFTIELQETLQLWWSMARVRSDAQGCIPDNIDAGRWVPLKTCQETGCTTPSTCACRLCFCRGKSAENG